MTKLGKFTLVPYIKGKAQVASVFPDDIMDAVTQAQDLVMFEGAEGVAILAPTAHAGNPVGMKVIDCLGDCGEITPHFQLTKAARQKMLLTGHYEVASHAG